jgi:hypothetical protein
MGRSKTKIIGKQYGSDVYGEGVVATGATVYPGMVLEKTGENADGEPIVQPVSTTDKLGESVRVALTPESPPHATDADIPREHEYTEGRNVQFQVLRSGDTVQNGLLADGTTLGVAADATVSYGEALGTSDDGTLKATATAGAIIARALEAVDNSTGDGTEGGVSAKRIAFEVV